MIALYTFNIFKVYNILSFKKSLKKFFGTEGYLFLAVSRWDEAKRSKKLFFRWTEPARRKRGFGGGVPGGSGSSRWVWLAAPRKGAKKKLNSTKKKTELLQVEYRDDQCIDHR